MRIASIKNKYMFKCKDKEQEDNFHNYLIYYDRKHKQYHAIQLTHLYYRDEKRFRQINNGYIKIEKFKEFEAPSGVKRDVYVSDVNGNKIDLKNPNVDKITKRHLSSKQSLRIMKFINRKQRIDK